ncbi:MAG: hypothetical protein KJ804_08750 [Proteobacteria bacterium]|nr:hypothetical protein [Pseudomonadota bacterium]MBU1058386.1 hypothetical protein [Pseudomonadota bacterium]
MHNMTTCLHSKNVFFLLPLLSLLLLSCPPGVSNTAQAQGPKIPAELEQWIPWVLYEQEEKMCSLETTEVTRRYCTWPSQLDLNASKSGAEFKQEWFIETRSLVPLPGKAPFWPREVQANGKDILVIEHQGHPAVWLNPGKQLLTGKFSWKELPEHLSLPPETGLVSLTLQGKKVTDLQLDEQGRLWFKQAKKDKKEEEESLTIQVFRKIEDGVPMRQQLRILLIVSGPPREVTLGLRTGENFVPLQIHSPLPVRLDKSDRLQFQVRPGQWQIDLALRNTTPLSPQHLSLGTIEGPWPGEEIWVFAAEPKLRQVEIEGLSPVEPSRTSLPQEWKKFPAYLIKTGEQMILTEKNRGNSTPVPNRLQLHRKFWLDEKGTGLTVLDNISGTMTRGWRLNVDSEQSLGKVEVAGSNRLITRLPGSQEIGVEVRQGALSLSAESRLERPVNNGRIMLPALGWKHTFQKLSGELNLPPGWKLLTASGIDKVPTWLNRWTLLDIFLVLIIGLAAGKILGWGWGAVALLTLVLTYHQPGAPRSLWLPLLGLLALQKLITAKNGGRICQISALLFLVAIIVSSLPYMVNEIQTGLYPQLEYGRYHRVSQEYDEETPSPQEDALLMESEATVQSSLVRRQAKMQSGGKGLYSSQAAPSPPQSIEVDPQALIQTGPGLPDWSWQKLPLTWNGPVRPEQKISFFLLSPMVNTALSFTRVLLLSLLISGFLRQCLLTGIGKWQTPATSVPSLLLCLLLPMAFLSLPQPAGAEVPPPELLQELQQRLLAPAECGEDCAAINSCSVQVSKDLLEVELRVDSLIRGAIPLPGQNRFFDQILLDGQTAKIFRLNGEGITLVRLEPGSHVVILKKDLQGESELSFTFPLLPQHAEAKLEDWSLSGLRENGALDKQITLSRIKPTTPEDNEKKRDANRVHIPAFVEVERTLHMGLEWKVTTKVIRRSPGTVISLDIPLLPGERVTTDSLQIKENRVKISMGPEEQNVSWHSAMQPVDTLTFTASATSSWTEVWFLDVSPIWHVQSQGFPEINQTDPAGKRYPEYHPYPGESLQLDVSRPEGVTGPTMTITKSRMTIKPGQRASDVSLFFSLTASRGLRHTVTLPPDIDLQKTLINNQEFPLQLDNNKLIIPVRPGKQDIEISWRSEQDIPLKLITQPVDLGMENVNTSIEMTLPSSRWILLSGGPRIGPAVLFWGELLVIILIALLLGRIKLTPLSTLQWLLLSLGLSQIPAPLAALVVIWLILLGLRKKKGGEITQATTFNIVQILLVLITFSALAALFYAIQQGLLGHPDMQIGGNGSSGHTLRWYQDRNVSILPTAWVISVPLLAYRISMLLWALWLALALLNWLRWGWDCFSDTTTWKQPPPQKKPLAKGQEMKSPASDPAPKKKAAAQTTAPPQKQESVKP